MDLIVNIEEKILSVHQKVEAIAQVNQEKVLDAFQASKVSDFHFQNSTGYGYNDSGREVLDQVYAQVFRAEAALVRPHFVSGTHTISVALFGVLRPGDELMYITGKPYDTLHSVIGTTGKGSGSLKEYGIGYQEIPLLENQKVDFEEVKKRCKKNTRVIAIQRSRGYDTRSSFTIDEIKEMIQQIRLIQPEAIIFVDNCYGEFVEEREPVEVGADLIAGSLIKNPGGGIVSSGGYIAGKKKWVNQAADRLTAPGLGQEVGAMLGMTRSIFQGLFLAPLLVSQAVKGAIFLAAFFEELGFKCSPSWDTPRTDLIQSIYFDNQENLIQFIQAIQYASPVDAHVTPVPWDMPGYTHPVIMAAGTFMQGGSLELTADAPIREPYVAFVQGGLTYAQVKYAAKKAYKMLTSLQRKDRI